MKKVIFMMGLALTAVFMVSCSNDQFEDMKTDALMDSIPSAYNDIMEFSNKKDFQMLVENGFSEGTRAVANYKIPSRFISLMDVIDPTADILNELSEEERDFILQNNLSYYEAFGYETIIPNENIARMININGEVIVEDSLYRITDMATFTTAKEDAQELQQYLCTVDHEELEAMISSAPETRVQLTPKVCAIKSYNNKKEEECFIADDLPITGGGGDSGNGGGSSSNGAKSNEPTGNILNQIPFATFPTYSSSSHTFVGKFIDKLVGERHSRHHEFKKGYRVSGSLYDYNYGFYRECGAYVSMDKKRGGLLKAINGWKDINADKLVLHIDHIALETKINISNDALKRVPNSPINLGFGYNGTSMEVCIFGKEWTINNIEKLLGKGLEQMIKTLKSNTKSDIPANTRSFLFVTPQKLYKVIYNTTIETNNKHKIREVFSSTPAFVISWNPLSWEKSVIDSIKETLNAPSYHIVDGQVKLAGKLNGNWGGMIINK